MLVQLLELACDPSMASAARMQQCLAVFFKAYASQSAQAHRHLSAAVLPAARRALTVGPSLAKSPAPQLLKFVSTLLQASTVSDNEISPLTIVCMSIALSPKHTAARRDFLHRP